MIANGSGSAAAATADEARKMDSENNPAASANHRYTVAAPLQWMNSRQRRWTSEQ